MKFKIFISVIIMMILLTGCVNNNQNMGEKDFNNNVSNQDENTNKTLETKKVNKGDSINLDFIEMNIESINIEEEIKIDTTSMIPKEDAEKVLKSAIANAVNNQNAKEDELFVSECFINPGPTLKRIKFASRGNVDRRDKRTSHITVKVSDGKVNEKGAE